MENQEINYNIICY